MQVVIDCPSLLHEFSQDFQDVWQPWEFLLLMCPQARLSDAKLSSDQSSISDHHLDRVVGEILSRDVTNYNHLNYPQLQIVTCALRGRGIVAQYDY